MYSKEEKIRRLKSLSRIEMEVMFYFSQGMTDNEICDKLNDMSIKTLNTRRTGIYKTLGIDAPDKEKQNYLSQEYVPVMPEVCPDEDALNRWRPTKSEPNEKISEEVQNTPRRRNFVLPAIIIAFVCILVGAGAYGGYLIGQGALQVPFLPSPTETQIALIPSETPQIVATAPLSATLPLIPTETLAPTLTVTPEPTSSPAPTEIIPPTAEILFQDNFDSGDLSNWTQVSGQWLVSNGKLTRLVDDSSRDYQWISLNRPEWINYIVSLDVNKPSNGTTFVVAVRNDTTKAKLIGFSVEYSDAIDLMLIASDYFDNSLISAKSEVEIPNESNVNIEIEVQGDTYILRTGNREVQRITFPGYASGGISIGVICYYEDEGCTTFDNIKVTYLP